MVGGCMAVLMRRRVVDRCVVGCCSWNCCTWTLTTICYDADEEEGNMTPFFRTFFSSPDGWFSRGEGILYIPWACGCLQAACAVDVVVGPILVNAADCGVTYGYCSADDPGSCCCVAWAGGLMQFDRLHWSLWDSSPFRRYCPDCSGVEPMDDEDWKDYTHDTYFGTQCC